MFSAPTALPQLIDGYPDGLSVPDGDAEIADPVPVTVRIPGEDLRRPWRLPGNLRPAHTITGPSARPPADPGQATHRGQRPAEAAASDEFLADPAEGVTWRDEAAGRDRVTGCAGAPMPHLLTEANRQAWFGQ